ncbi:MAG: hypothetical protein L3K04_07930 [Thermoplasmata archaeon]|nr:hypothetical protein [Thermoplasmata archaeon]
MIWANNTAGFNQAQPVLSGSYTVSGLTLLLLLGIVLLIAGVLVLVLGALAKAKPKVVYEEEQEEKFHIGPMAKDPNAEPAAAASTPPPPRPKPTAPPVEYRPERPAPARYMKETEPYAMPNEPPTAGSERPQLTCRKCGTVNEPWVTNCRNCKRPLSHTG